MGALAHVRAAAGVEASADVELTARRRGGVVGRVAGRSHCANPPVDPAPQLTDDTHRPRGAPTQPTNTVRPSDQGQLAKALRPTRAALPSSGAVAGCRGRVVGTTVASELGDQLPASQLDRDIVEAATSQSTPLGRRRDEPVTAAGRPDELDLARARHRSHAVRVARDPNAQSASTKIDPPWTLPTPLTIIGDAVIETVAVPGPTSSSAIPRAGITPSASIITSAKRRARASSNTV